MSRHQRPGAHADGGEHVGHRHDRLEHLLLEELNGLLRGEVTDPRLDDVAFSRVELSVDYSSARAYFVTITAGALPRPARERIEAALEHASGFLRARVGAALDLKRVPQLRFRYDPDASGHIYADEPAR